MRGRPEGIEGRTRRGLAAVGGCILGLVLGLIVGLLWLGFGAGAMLLAAAGAVAGAVLSYRWPGPVLLVLGLLIDVGLDEV